MKKSIILRIVWAAAGIVLVGTGVAFNAAAALGNDPVGIVYDGIRNAAHLSAGQLGTASNIVNIVLVAAVFCWGRRYISIGTFIYLIPYGFVVDWGGRLYQLLFHSRQLPVRIAGATAGCLLLYTGVAIYITADVGLDPFTGFVMTIKDRVKKEFQVVKICFDLCCILCGVLLGGKLGVITVVTAVLAGPLIQLFAGAAEKIAGRKRG